MQSRPLTEMVVASVAFCANAAGTANAAARIAWNNIMKQSYGVVRRGECVRSVKAQGNSSLDHLGFLYSFPFAFTA